MQCLVSVKVTGLKELQAALENIPRNIARRLLREVLRKAAGIWREEMSLRAPRLSEVKLATNAKNVRIPGDLARHIGMKVKVNSGLEGEVQVGPVKRVFWALFLEFGTRKQSARPFIRPAFEAKRGDVLTRFIEEGKKIVAEETR